MREEAPVELRIGLCHPVAPPGSFRLRKTFDRLDTEFETLCRSTKLAV